MTFKKITIVGLGLMGGSLAAACRKKFKGVRVSAVSRNREALNYALRKKWIHEGTQHLAEGIRNADLIVLCTPVDTLKKLLVSIDRLASGPISVTDVGSVKADLVRWTRKKKFRNVRFVGAHPMVGSHQRGVSFAQPDLYSQGDTFLMPKGESNRKAYSQVRSFWKSLSRQVIICNAQLHDAVVGEISHLPHAVAACLTLAVSAQSFKHAATGFRDTTRIAEGSPSIWLPIFLTNKRAVVAALAKFQQQVKKFQRELKRSDNVALKRFLNQAVRRHKQI